MTWRTSSPSTPMAPPDTHTLELVCYINIFGNNNAYALAFPYIAHFGENGSILFEWGQKDSEGEKGIY